MSNKEKNRAAFPETASMVDELREVFGDGVTLVWAEENGRTIGNKGPDGVQPIIERTPGGIKQYGRGGIGE